MAYMRDSWSRTTQVFPPPGAPLTSSQPRQYVQYSLPDPDSTIRLLHLLPGINGPLKCSIMEVPLNTAPEYDAVSYHWGDPSPTQTLWIGPFAYPIATSIYQALQKVRDGTVSRILWIDGVCISQTDIDEKSRQIQLLRRIFQQAQHVFIWLGPQMDGSELLPSFFESIVRAQKEFYHKVGDVPNLLQTPLSSGLYHVVGLPDNNDLKWDTIPNFFAREWFRRVWVIQEVVLARNPIVMCGHWQFTWQELSRAMWAILRLDLPRTIGTTSAIFMVL